MLFSGLAAAESTARVENVQGAPAFVIDGAPHCGLSFMSYVGPQSLENGVPALAGYVKGLAQADCDLYTFVTDLGGVYGYSPSIWPERDRWDFSYLDTHARMVLDAAPPNAKLILQLFIDAPAWWVRENPSECMILSNGTADFGEKLFALPRKDNFPSLASRKWREDMKLAIEKLIEHVAQAEWGGRVVGYQVCGQKTEEWYHWSMNCEELGDYSPHMLAAFRTWLQERYDSDERLQSTWNQPEATRSSAAIPTKSERYGTPGSAFRNPRTEQAVIDFHRFWSDIMADTIAYFSRVIKDKTGRTKTVGAFYAYSFEFADLVEDAGHLALGKLLQCPDLDFIMAPGSYQRRALKGGQGLFRAPVLSINQHGKLLWNDFDPASYKFYQKDQQALAPWKEQLAVTDTPEEFTYMIRRDLGNALANGVNIACFDLHGGYYDDPVILASVKKSRETRMEALTRDRRSDAEILVVFDEDSQHFMGFRNTIARHLLIEQIAELPFVGPFDAVLLSDLASTDTTRYKLALVVNVFRLDAAQRGVIDTKLKHGGKSVVWLYAPGYFRGDSGPADLSGITDAVGMDLASRPKPTPGSSAVFGEGLPPMYLLDGEQFVVTDPDVEALARRSEEAKETVVARKRLPDWTSIYSASAPLSKQFLRRLAADAGVHSFHDREDDVVYANASYLTLVASPEAGPRTIHLKRKATVTDATTGEKLCEQADAFMAAFKSSEARIFRLD